MTAVRIARLVRTATLSVALVVSLVACGAPASTGVVTGGIEPCQGIIFAGGPRYAAGTVAVYAGELHWKSTGLQTMAPAFPDDLVGTLHVDENSTYRFVLPPGAYVLRAQYDRASTAAPWVSVSIRAGQTATDDIPNMCI